jgi:hypothetical protein
VFRFFRVQISWWLESFAGGVPGWAHARLFLFLNKYSAVGWMGTRHMAGPPFRDPRVFRKLIFTKI